MAKVKLLVNLCMMVLCTILAVQYFMLSTDATTKTTIETLESDCEATTGTTREIQKMTVMYLKNRTVRVTCVTMHVIIIVINNYSMSARWI